MVAPASTHAAAAWTKSTGVGVIVAIIDTGVDESNPDLKGQLVAGAHLDKTGRIVAGDVTDTYGHGTHVAGIIAGNDDGHGITGIAPGAKVMPINVDTPLLDGNDGRRRDPLGHRPRRQRRQPVAGLRRHQAVPVRRRADLRRLRSTRTTTACVIVASAGNDGEGLDLPSAPGGLR